MGVCVKRECVHCKRQDLSPCQQPMSPLSDLRDTQSFPFTVTGLDRAGHLYCCDFPRKKFWVLFFTCGVIRAVHLELVQSLSTEQKLLALRRSASRRGCHEWSSQTMLRASLPALSSYKNSSAMWLLIGDLLPHAPHGGEVGGNNWSIQSSRHWKRPLEDIPSLAPIWRPHCMR